MKNSWQNLIRPFFILLLVVIGCAAAARFLTGKETLAEYAEKNPEIAYAGRNSSEDAADGAALTEHPAADGEDAASPNAADADAETAVPVSADESTPADVPPEEPAYPEPDDADVRDARVTLEEHFFYEPIPASVYARMVGASYPEDCPIPLDSLRYLRLLYVDFDDAEQIGELVCHESAAQDLIEIFYGLYQARYQLQSVRLIDDYGGDDDLSMLDNNTSCFNYRTVAGSTSLSNHARGLAVDVNPFYNPWVNHGRVSPPEAEEYADRTADFAHKIDKDDLCYQLFHEHGFFWGGDWNNPDYQHFQRN